MQNTFSVQLKKDEIENVRGVLVSFDWESNPVNTPYMVFKMKSPLNSVAILYTSGKIVFQGNEDFTQIIGAIQSDHQETENFIPHIGVDEVGKGDYFGPMVVVSCFVDETFLKKLEHIGIGDSKKFSDKKIMDMYDRIKDYPYYYASVIYPEEYAELVEEHKNVSIVLAKQHSMVIERALKDLHESCMACTLAVIDQFSNSKNRILDELGPLGKKIDVVQFHKGESDIAVAAASVIARGIFLEEWAKMSQKYGFHFPKGASNVIDDARVFVDEFGYDELKKVAKVSFKTTEKVLQKNLV
jgi:ribonuclease HIII